MDKKTSKEKVKLKASRGKKKENEIASKTISLRIKPSDHRVLVREARKNRMSLSRYIITASLSY